MSTRMGPLDLVLGALVIVHFAVSVVHGRAHTGAHVPLSTPAFLFVVIVILAAPVVGLLLRWRLPRGGAWVMAAALAGSFVFGVVNHFAIDGADHVSRVAEPWRVMFSATAVLLGVTESLGSVLAVWSAVRARRLS